MVIHESLHRTVKIAIDTGEASTIEEARDRFMAYRLHVVLGRDAGSSRGLQAAMLTAVNTGRRCFLGGLTVSGPMEAGLLVDWPGCRTLGDAVRNLGGRVAAYPEGAPPVLLLGNAVAPAAARVTLRASFEGWTAGVAPAEDGWRLDEGCSDFTPAGVLAGALGVSEVFQYLRRTNPAAGRRKVEVSLWNPGMKGTDRGPSVSFLPARLWLIGLGHLGQAVLWTLGLLAYRAPHDVQLVLQDFDELNLANESTSLLLTKTTQLGRRKTRAMAEWCERRGFRTTIVERHFGENLRVMPDEPGVAICGVDNPQARAALESVGFDRIVEAGLGAGPSEYLAFQVHTFPSAKRAIERWSGPPISSSSAALLMQPAYHALRTAGVDECGVVQLAQGTVGAAFVGAAVSTVVVAELIRMANGWHRHELIDGTLRCPADLSAFRVADLAPYNPGTTAAKETVS